MSDVPNWADKLAAWSTLGQLFIVIGALFVAYKQLNSWRAPAMRQRQAETALSILLHANTLKEELLYARRLFDSDNEIDARYGRSPDYSVRLVELREIEHLVTALAGDRIRQRYLIGDRMVDAIIGFFIKCEEELKAAFRGLSEVDGGNIFIASERDERVRGMWRTAVEQDRDNDQFRIRIRENFENLERQLRPVIDLK